MSWPITGTQPISLPYRRQIAASEGSTPLGSATKSETQEVENASFKIYRE